MSGGHGLKEEGILHRYAAAFVYSETPTICQFFCQPSPHSFHHPPSHLHLGQNCDLRRTRWRCGTLTSDKGWLDGPQAICLARAQFVHQTLHARTSQRCKILLDGRKRRPTETGFRNVVKADHRDGSGNLDPAFFESTDCPQRLNTATPKAGVGFELDVIAAVFIGVASASGGVGKVMGAVIGAFIMGVMNNGMSIMGVGIDWQQMVKGLVLLAAVIFDVYNKNKL